MDLSIIIPSLRKDELKFCLESIRDHTQGIEYEILIVIPFGPWEKYEFILRFNMPGDKIFPAILIVLDICAMKGGTG